MFKKFLTAAALILVSAIFFDAGKHFMLKRHLATLPEHMPITYGNLSFHFRPFKSFVKAHSIEAWGMAIGRASLRQGFFETQKVRLTGEKITVGSMVEASDLKATILFFPPLLGLLSKPIESVQCRHFVLHNLSATLSTANFPQVTIRSNKTDIPWEYDRNTKELKLAIQSTVLHVNDHPAPVTLHARGDLNLKSQPVEGTIMLTAKGLKDMKLNPQDFLNGGGVFLFMFDLMSHQTEDISITFHIKNRQIFLGPFSLFSF